MSCQSRPVISAACLLAGAGLLLAGCASGRSAARVAESARARASAESAIGQQATAAPHTTAFEPIAASFITPDAGWALGHSGCQACAALLRTSDGGLTWTTLPNPHVTIGAGGGPAGSVSNIAFANVAEGFLYGPALLATRNGGRTWTRLALPAVQGLVIGGGYAYAVTGPAYGRSAGIWRTAIGSHRWMRLPLPSGMMPVPAGANFAGLTLYAEGRMLALLQTGDTSVEEPPGWTGRLWASTSDGEHWQARTVPCKAPDGGGASVMSIALGHPDAWLLDCYNNEQSSQQQNTQHLLYGSVNAGRSWVRLPDPTSGNLPELLADNGAGHAFLATEGAADFMTGTLDHGLHWRVRIMDGGSFSGWADLGFVTPDVGFVVGPANAFSAAVPGGLYRTENGGRTWKLLRV